MKKWYILFYLSQENCKKYQGLQEAKIARRESGERDQTSLESTKIDERSESDYYKCSNPNVGSTEQELIDIFEHKIYSFLLNL